MTFTVFASSEGHEALSEARRLVNDDDNTQNEENSDYNEDGDENLDELVGLGLVAFRVINREERREDGSARGGSTSASTHLNFAAGLGRSDERDVKIGTWRVISLKNILLHVSLLAAQIDLSNDTIHILRRDINQNITIQSRLTRHIHKGEDET